MNDLGWNNQGCKLIDNEMEEDLKFILEKSVKSNGFEMEHIARIVREIHLHWNSYQGYSWK